MNANLDLAPQEDDAAKALAADLASLEAELAAQKNLYLRLAADFDNFRKRTAQETDRRAAAQKQAFLLLRPVADVLHLQSQGAPVSFWPSDETRGVALNRGNCFKPANGFSSSPGGVERA